MKQLLIVSLFFLLFSFLQPVAAAQMPTVGSVAPDFILPSQDGKDVSLSDYAGKWVVLYFYPKDFTSGCSVQAQKFQQDIDKYSAKNAVIVGVSIDSVASHKEFCTKQGLGFTLLSDEQHTVSTLYGSYDDLIVLGLAARNTFLINPKGVIAKVYVGVNPATHSSEVLEDLNTLTP